MKGSTLIAMSCTLLLLQTASAAVHFEKANIDGLHNYAHDVAQDDILPKNAKGRLSHINISSRVETSKSSCDMCSEVDNLKKKVKRFEKVVKKEKKIRATEKKKCRYQIEEQKKLREIDDSRCTLDKKRKDERYETLKKVLESEREKFKISKDFKDETIKKLREEHQGLKEAIEKLTAQLKGQKSESKSTPKESTPTETPEPDDDDESPAVVINLPGKPSSSANVAPTLNA